MRRMKWAHCAILQPEQQAHAFDVWAQPMVQQRLPLLFNLRSDPFERSQHEAGDYVRWFIEHAFVLVPAQAIVGQFLTTFQDFPPRQRPAPLASSRRWKSCGCHHQATDMTTTD